MKRHIEIQNTKSIKDALTGSDQTILKLKPNSIIIPNRPSVGGAGGRLPTGPPGRSRSPGVIRPDRFTKPVRSGLLEQNNPHLYTNCTFSQYSLSVRLSSRRSLSKGNRLNTEHTFLTNTKFQFITNIKFLLS